MSKLSDTEVVTALEDAMNIGDAPIGKYWGCIITKQVAKEALDLINRQQAEIERLKSLILEFMDCVSKWSAKQYNDLSDEINKIPVMDKCRGKVKEIKSEAYKECIEKVRELGKGVHPCSDELRIFDSDLDNLLKEMG